LVLVPSLSSLWTATYEVYVLNSLVIRLIMKFDQNNINDYNEIVHEKNKVKQREHCEDLNYLYPELHRIDRQIRWFKGSRNRGLNSDMAA